MRRKLLSLAFALLLLCFAPFGVRAEEGDFHAFYDGIVASQKARHGAESAQAWIDGALADGAGVTSEWYALALCQGGEFDFSTYEDALLSYISTHTVYSATTRQKLALALIGVIVFLLVRKSRK